MKALLNRLHSRVGDLWWYSAMIFLACRSGDAIQAFIGLWLVPKYVSPQELGAVLPLQQLTSFLTVPLAVVAVVFSKYVNTYATRGEYGKVKSFIHDVFVCSFVLFVICIAGAYFLMPFFYERLRIASGSLTFLILLCGLVTNIGSIVGSAQQGLKRFKTMSLMALISAPIRLVTLLIAMPIRALSGYILGQTTPSATTSALALIDIHKALKPYTPDTSWRKDWRQILNYTWPIAIYTLLMTLFGTLTATIYRQRLPEIESAAYYLLTRFTEIAGYVSAAVMVVVFPLASEAHEAGDDNPKLLRNAILATIAASIILAIVLAIFGNNILSISEVWSTYKDFAHLLPWLAIAHGSSNCIVAIVTFEMVCRRFGVAAFLICVNIIWTVFIVSFTGYEFFNGILPDAVVAWMESIHLAHINTMTWATLIANALQIAIIHLTFRNRGKQP